MTLDTDRQTATNAHDINVQQQQPKPRHRSRPTRSPSLSRSSTNGSTKRSSSPIITFHPAPLSAENTKGVKNITRKVIRRLEGLGHLEMVDLNLSVSEEEEEPEKLRRNGTAEGGEDSEVDKLLYALGKEAVKTSQSKKTNGMTEQKPTPNLEIPRKVFHASIGLFSFFGLNYISPDFFCPKASLPYIFIYRRAMCALLLWCCGWHWLLSFQLNFSGSNHRRLNACTNDF